MQMGKPLSQYAACKVGPTVLVWTTDGIVDLSAFLTAATVLAPGVLVSAPMGNTLRNLTPDFATLPVTTAYLPSEQIFLANLPSTLSTIYVFETSVKAWTQWRIGVSTANWSNVTNCIAVCGDVLYLADGVVGNVMKYDVAAVDDNGGGSARLPIASYSRQTYTKLSNGRVGFMTTASPRTNYDNTQYLTCRIVGDMAGTTYNYPAVIGSIFWTADPSTTPVALATDLYAGVTAPQFAITPSTVSESFSFVMALSQQRAKPIRWYETRIGFKMGGSR
jgi:hypothetical protein